MGTQLPQRGTAPPIFAHVRCGQTAGCIKMRLGTEVGVGPGDIVLDGNPAPHPKKGAQPPIFGPCLLCPNGWMDQDTTWYGGRPQPRRQCVTRGPSFPPLIGAQPRNFRPISVVAKRLGGLRCHLVWMYASALCQMGTQLPSLKGHSPQFLAHVCCGQTAGWMKTPLGTE